MLSRKYLSINKIIAIFLIIAAAAVAAAGYKKFSKPAVKNIIIDNTEDIASLGFPGQRKIVSDSEKNIYIAYRKKYNKYYQIFVAKLSTKNNYSSVNGTLKPITEIPKKSQRVPSIAIDSRDTIHIVWYGADKDAESENERQIKYVKSEDKGITWNAVKNIAPVYEYKKEEYWQEHPNIYIGKNDVIYVVWEGKDKNYGKPQIKFAKSENRGDTWSEWENIMPFDSYSQSRPSVIEDGSNGIYIFMYSSKRNGVEQIEYSYSADNGESWSEWLNISKSNFDSRSISAAYGNKNEIYAAFRAPSQSNGPSQIYYAKIKNSESVTSKITNSPNFQFFPNITYLEKTNKIYIVWTETENSSFFPKEKPENGKIYISYLKKNNKFSTPLFLNSKSEALYPNLPLKISSLDFIPVIYVKKTNNHNYEIIFSRVYK